MLFCLFVVCALVQLGTCNEELASIYPVPSFARTLIPTDPFESSYCLNDGTTQSTQSNYKLVNSCLYAAVSWHSSESIPGGEAVFGNLEGSAVAITNLGNQRAISQRYGFDFAWGSLRYTLTEQLDLVIGSNDTSVPLHQNDYIALLQTKEGNVSIPGGDYGEYHIIRVTFGPQNSMTVGSHTSLLVLAVMVDRNRLRWGIIASVDPDAATKAYAQELGEYWSDPAQSLSVIALVVALLAVLATSWIGFVQWKTRGYTIVQ